MLTKIKFYFFNNVIELGRSINKIVKGNIIASE